MDLSTTYLGLKLAHPIIAGAGPLSDDLDSVKELEDAGSSAIVLRSIFEEQITSEEVAESLYQDESSSEANSYFPSADSFVFGVQEYLNHLRRIKQSVHIPVIASLNGSTPGGWLSYSREIEQAGADALELNVFHSPLNAGKSSDDIEREILGMVRDVKSSIKIPVAVKLSPLFTSFAHFAVELERQGVDGFVLFNRFFDADIDVRELEITRTLHLSTSAELPIRLRGIAAIAPLVRASLAITGGVHTALDVVKSIMAGAHVTQMVSALLKNGSQYLTKVRNDLADWMYENEWQSVREMRGNMAVNRIPDPQAYARANYIMLLQSWRD